MTTNIREIITNLIDHNVSEMAYYDHSDNLYSFQDRVTTIHQMPHYGNDFHNDYEPCIIFAGSGDYIGSTIDMANRRYVENEYPELFENGSIEYHNLSYGYTALIIFFLRPSVARSGLLDDIEHLPDYPLLEDELESIIIQEILEESWDNWLSNDFESELGKLTGIDFDNTDWQEQLFWEILYNGSGGEYYPEGMGESVYVDMNEVFKDSENLIETVQLNHEKLDSGEYEINGNWNKVGYNLTFDWNYAGEHDHKTRTTLHERLKSQKIDTIPDNILKEFGFRWFPINKLFWEVTPINAKLKEAIKKGITQIVPVIHDENCYCENCHQHTVMFVHFGNPHNVLYVCPDCYNKLMAYWPKCNHCQIKNVSTSLQYSFLPVEDTTTLTHCKDCKNLLLSL